MLQLVLRQVPLALDADHDLDVAVVLGPRPRAGHPGEVALGLVRARGHPEGVGGEGGVPQPGEAEVGAATIAPLGW
jgi:hypothetical protein